MIVWKRRPFAEASRSADGVWGSTLASTNRLSFGPSEHTSPSVRGIRGPAARKILALIEDETSSLKPRSLPLWNAIEGPLA